MLHQNSALIKIRLPPPLRFTRRVGDITAFIQFVRLATT